MTQETLKKLYKFNLKPENWTLKPYTPGTKHKAGDQWGGPRARRLLVLAYTLAFSCLLRADEVLKIQSHDLTLLDPDRLELKLPFRKTSQFGCVSGHAVCSSAGTDHLTVQPSSHLCCTGCLYPWHISAQYEPMESG
jgi:hypothetical protein